MKRVLFYRDFQRFTGGHLKVWDYFNHVAASLAYEPRVSFSPDSKWDSTNPWSDFRTSVVEWEPNKGDVLFLGGTDWRALPESQRANFPKPVINLIQHPRHADAGSELREFLKHRALRICVSEEVAEAIKQTGEVNGPVFVIPNGIDLSAAAEVSPNERKIDILICGLKAPELARDLQAALANTHGNVRAITDWMPRAEFLRHLADAKITVFLPRPVEGFYLPPLEGMACGTVVVCPDCLGNRSFCIDRVNCFSPPLNVKAIATCAEIAQKQTDEERTRMLERAKETALMHSLMSERESFLRLLRSTS